MDQDLNAYWKTVVDTIQDGVMIVDTEGTIVSVNRAFRRVTGYSEEDILGQACAILNCSACGRARKSKGSAFCMMFEKGALRMQKCVLTAKDGGEVHVVKNASVLVDHSGTVSGAVETLTDVTDLVDKERQIETYRRELEDEDRFQGMIGASKSMMQVFTLIENASRSDAPVIIYGESGTGKELVANAIHNLGPRRKKPYVKVNCAALNESLLESELFGHVKGAFTGAYQSRLGRFEAAQDGDIFLDEIGDLPFPTQVKLLRVLEDKIIERVGDSRPIQTDVRIISATNKDLHELVDQGSYREDFFYRINVIPIVIPPLRDRPTDIPLLAKAFFQRIRLKSSKKIRGISNNTLEHLVQYKWPGNVRELKSAFEYAFVSCQGAEIEPWDLPAPVRDLSGSSPNSNSAPEPRLDDIKKQRLVDALKKAGGNRSKAARILGISRTSVWSQMKRYSIRM